MRAGHALDLRKLLQQLDADLAALGPRVTGPLQPPDDALRDMHPEEILVHPPRRLDRGDGPDADEDEEPLQKSVIAKPREIAAQQTEIEAVLGLDEVRAGLDLGLEGFRPPAGLRIMGGIGRADEEPRRRRNGTARRQGA